MTTKNKALTISKGRKTIIALAAINACLSALMGYAYYLIVIANRVYAVSQQDEYVRDTRIFWSVNSAVLIFLVVEGGIIISWLRGKRKLDVFLCGVTLFHFIVTLTYLFIMRESYLRESLLCSFLFLTTLILDPLLLWTFFKERQESSFPKNLEGNEQD